MKLWSFVFTNPVTFYSSARVAANTRLEAFAEISDRLGESIPPGSTSVICTHMGEADSNMGVVQLLRRDDV